jgi:lipopolysaccharide export system permease protein
MGIILQMSALKLPEIALKLLPFAILIAGVACFWRLTRNYELVVMRAAGVSVWQFLAAPVCLVFILGVVIMSVINPLVALSLSAYDRMEMATLEQGQGHTVQLAPTGFWLRQDTLGGGFAIIHAKHIKIPEWRLSPVTALFFDANYKQTHRIDSTQATLTNKQWVFSEAWLNQPQQNQPRYFQTLQLPSPINPTELENRFASPETISFWRLPAYMKILSDTGFHANSLRAYYYSLLAGPWLNVGLVLLAAAITLRAPRMQRAWPVLASTLGIGFFVFFMSDFLAAFGIADRLPLVLTAAAPACITILAGLTALLYAEDG